MNSFAARSKVCGPIFRRMHKQKMMRNIKILIPIDLPFFRWPQYFAASPASSSRSATRSWPLIKEYCAGCHSDKAKTGGVSFEGITAASIAKDPELFEKAVRKLRGRVMPPPGAKQPEGKAVDSLVVVARRFARQGTQPGARHRPGCAASLEPQGI